jgi:hypothetical protein
LVIEKPRECTRKSTNDKKDKLAARTSYRVMGTPQLSDYHPLMTPDAIVIYPSREKLILLACGGAGFVALAFWLLRSTSTCERWVGLASVLFFGLGTLHAVVRIARRTPVLIIHPSGIFIHAAGFLRWDEISDVFVARIQRQRYLAIDVKDVKALSRRQSWLKAGLMKMNCSFFGAAIYISANTLPMSLEELIQNMEQKITCHWSWQVACYFPLSLLTSAATISSKRTSSAHFEHCGNRSPALKLALCGKRCSACETL